MDKCRSVPSYIECDTLLLSVGLIPENELSRLAGISIDPVTMGPYVDECMQTLVDGIFACGNVLHVHDLVDHVTKESRLAGRCAVKYLTDRSNKRSEIIKVNPGNDIRYVVPHFIKKDSLNENIELLFRVTKILNNVRFYIESDGKVVHSFKKTRVAPGEMESVILDPKMKIYSDITIRMDGDDIND